jgi:hypothetical protein
VIPPHHHHAPPVTTASGISAAATKPLHKGGHVKQQQHVHHNAVPTTRDYLAKLNTTIDFSSDKDSSPTKDTSNIAIANCNASGSGSGSTNANSTTPSPTGGIRGRGIPLSALSTVITADSVTPPKPSSRITSPGL